MYVRHSLAGPRGVGDSFFNSSGLPARRGVGDSFFDSSGLPAIDTSAVMPQQTPAVYGATYGDAVAALPLTTIAPGGLTPSQLLPAGALDTGIPTSWLLGLAAALGVLALGAVFGGGKGRR